MYIYNSIARSGKPKNFNLPNLAITFFLIAGSGKFHTCQIWQFFPAIFFHLASEIKFLLP